MKTIDAVVVVINAVLVGGSFAPSELLATVHPDNTRPNIVMLMADDLGWGDVGFNGNTVIQTPNLDAMANNGIKLTQFYAAAPVCSPTRGSVLTGRHPLRYGIEGANRGHLRQQEITLAEVLKEQGYKTGHFGKWHLGTLDVGFGKHDTNENPENYMTPGMAGFDEWYSTQFAVGTYDPYVRDEEHSRVKHWIERKDLRALYWHSGNNPQKGQVVGKILSGDDSEIIMRQAVKFIENSVAIDAPFLSVIWFHAPHIPIVGNPYYMNEYYKDYTEAEQHYYSVVTALDAQIGVLRQTLRDLKIADNTLVMFASDNGPVVNSDPQKRTKGTTKGFKGGKRSLYEGGIRVPAVIEWPTVLASINIDTAMVTSDYFPTIMDILDLPMPNRPYDGESMLKVLKGNQDSRKNPIAFRFKRASKIKDVMIHKKYKLIQNNYPDGYKRRQNDPADVELYNLKKDPYEEKNIADKHPSTVKRLTAKLAVWKDSLEKSANQEDYD